MVTTVNTTEELSAQQKEVLQGVEKWLANVKESPATTPQICYVAGYAGTGKTTIAKHLVKDVKGRVCFAAFTGKAARVLRSKGCAEATTVHRLIYQAKTKSQKRLQELREKLDKAKGNQAADLEREVHREAKESSRPSFVLDKNGSLVGAQLLVLDECSMISRQLAEDILSFGVPVLVLGDEAQLPPVKGAGYFTLRKPDYLLTEVHRQVADSPVLQLATQVRQGISGGLFKYVPVTKELLQSVDQVLVGKNETRRLVNLYLRKLRNPTSGKSPYPTVGDRLVCLKNDHDRGLLNGMILRAETNSNLLGGDIAITVKEEEDNIVQEVVAVTEPFDRYTNPLATDRRSFWERKELIELDYAYALTVHKSQGSQWDCVLLLDDGFAYDRQKWLYTAITRAAKVIYIARFVPGDFRLTEG